LRRIKPYKIIDFKEDNTLKRIKLYKIINFKENNTLRRIYPYKNILLSKELINFRGRYPLKKINF